MEMIEEKRAELELRHLNLDPAQVTLLIDHHNRKDQGIYICSCDMYKKGATASAILDEIAANLVSFISDETKERAKYGAKARPLEIRRMLAKEGVNDIEEPVQPTPELESIPETKPEPEKERISFLRGILSRFGSK